MLDGDLREPREAEGLALPPLTERPPVRTGGQPPGDLDVAIRGGVRSGRGPSYVVAAAGLPDGYTVRRPNQTARTATSTPPGRSITKCHPKYTVATNVAAR